jgi:lipopolysaccharide export system permease protein
METGNNKNSFSKALAFLNIKIIDIYIIRKFLGTFFFSLVLILTIAVVFDFAEKVDNFMQTHAPVRAIVFDYYFNFVPYFAMLFAPLFVFISVIFFTSKMAVNTEIIAILNSGMSYIRLMLPYFLSSLVIAIFTFVLTNFVIPHANLVRIKFEDRYVRNSAYRAGIIQDFHRQVYPRVYAYMKIYNPIDQTGSDFSLEKFDENGHLESKLVALKVSWDTTINKWCAMNYYIRDIKGFTETVTRGLRIDTTLTFEPKDFARDPSVVGTMTYNELNSYINLLKLQGSDELKLFQIEKYRRISDSFAIFILTLIGVSLSSQKIRGGIGMQIGLGLALSFSYILFMQFASQFSLKGDIEPMVAIWIPNILYTVIAVFLYKMAPK